MKKVYLFVYLLFISTDSNAASLTLRAAQQLALTNQPLLESQRAMVTANQQYAIAAGQLPDPQLKFGLQNVPTDDLSLTDDFMTMKTLGIEQDFYGGQKSSLRKRKAEITVQQSEIELALQTKMLQREVGIAWLELFYSLQLVKLLQEKHKILEHHLQSLQITYKTNLNLSNAVFNAKDMLNQLVLEEKQAQAGIEKAQLKLQRWIGESQLIEENLPEIQPWALEKLMESLPNHPELRLYDQKSEIARAELNLARAERKPDWMLGLEYADRAAPFTNMVSVEVGIDLPVFPKNRQDKNITAATLLLDDSIYQKEDRLRQLKMEVSNLYADWGARKQQVGWLQQNTLPNLEQAATTAAIAYKNNQMDLADIFASHHEVLEAKLQLVEQQVEMTKVAIQLEYFNPEQSHE